jgi:hypothetical protein
MFILCAPVRRWEEKWERGGCSLGFWDFSVTGMWRRETVRVFRYLWGRLLRNSEGSNFYKSLPLLHSSSPSAFVFTFCTRLHLLHSPSSSALVFTTNLPQLSHNLRYSHQNPCIYIGECRGVISVTTRDPQQDSTVSQGSVFPPPGCLPIVSTPPQGRLVPGTRQGTLFQHRLSWICSTC